MDKINKCISYFEFDQELYKKELDCILEDENTQFFLDTSFLYKLLFIKPSSRHLILDWIKGKGKNVHVPYWTYIEYMKKGVNKSQIKDIGPWANFKHAKELESYKRELYLYLDSSVLGNFFSSIAECQTEYKKAIDIIQKIENLTNDFSVAHSEICNALFPSHVMKKLNSIKTFTDDFKIRCEAKVPPGYAETKPDNKCGDYIIWNEILECTENQEQASVWLTLDNKNDWVYTPEKILFNGKWIGNPQKNLKNNNIPYVFPLKIALPQLCLEYQQKKGKDDFYVLTIFSLMERLLYKSVNNGDNKYEEFRLMLSEENDGMGESEYLDSKCENAENHIKKVDQSSALNSATGSSAKSIPYPQSVYDINVVNDAEYIPNDDELDQCIKSLKSHYWYEQSAGFNKFLQNQQDYKTRDKNKLFLIGRNIYQAACGNERDSLAYLRDLRKNIVKLFDSDRNNHILNGMFFEVYFNAYGELRSQLKAAYLPLLLPSLDSCNKTTAFISKCLEPYKEKLLFIPGTDERVDFSIEGDLYSEDHIDISSIKIKNIELLKQYDEYREVEKCDSYYLLNSSFVEEKKMLYRKLSTVFTIPEDKIIIKIDDKVKYWKIKRGYRINSECPFLLNDPSL